MATATIESHSVSSPVENTDEQSVEGEIEMDSVDKKKTERIERLRELQMRRVTFNHHTPTCTCDFYTDQPLY